VNEATWGSAETRKIDTLSGTGEGDLQLHRDMRGKSSKEDLFSKVKEKK